MTEYGLTDGVRTAVLRLAKQAESAGKLHEACDIYFKLVHDYADSPEAEEAQRSLLLIARGYEEQGKTHLALDLYQKLL